MYVVIIGFSQSKGENVRLETDGKWRKVSSVSPYMLIPNIPILFIKQEKQPISELPEAYLGNQHVDNDGLLLKNELEKAEAEKDPIAAKYVRKYLGAEELINDKHEWCLWLVDSTPEERRKSKFLKQRIESVKIFRSSSKRPSTKNASSRAWEFAAIHQPNVNYLAIPKTFSENRDYFTAGYESPAVIASDALFTVEDPSGFAFSCLETSMFMAWQDLVGGRLEMRKRFSNTLVWNTFPLPKLSKDQKDLIIEGGRKVLEARANYPGSSLAALYAPDNMPQDLKRPTKPSTRPWTPYSPTSPLEAKKSGRRRCWRATRR